jgi:hypothetical protein
VPSQYGYMNYYTPPRQTPLAQAAAAKDPYGLAPNNRSGPLGIGSSTGFAAPPAAPKPTYTQAQVQQSLAANPLASHGGYEGLVVMPQQYTSPPTAAAVNSYDISTDPALKQIQSLAGLSDQQAQAGALQQRQDLLLSYGDPTLAASVLGPTDPIVTAAAQNPTSTVAQLGQQRDRNLKTLEDQLNAANLGYSGYKVTQETQAGQDFQNALAQAAAQLNQNLGGVDSTLAQALAANNEQRVQGINSAADRAAQQAMQTGVDPGALAGAAAGADTGSTVGANTAASQVDPVTQAIINKGLSRRQDFLNFGLRNSGML